MHLRRLAIATLVLVAVDLACYKTPEYTPPPVAMPATFKERGDADTSAEWKTAEPRDTAHRGPWWELFGDARLDALEARLDSSNQSVAAAAANMAAARAAVRVTRAQLYPTITTSPSIIGSHLPTGFGRQLGVTFANYSLPVDVSWEPDFWNRVRSSIQAGAFAAQAAAADFENVRLSAHAELATDYFGLRAQDILRRVLDSVASAQQETLALTRVLYAAGRVNDGVVAQAEAQLDATRAQATNTGVLRAQYEHAIAVLVGEPPSTFAIPPDPRWPRAPVVPVGVPSALLERRPDVAAAERAVGQANAQIGVAKAAFFPTLTLAASGGVLSTSLASLFSWPSRVWSAGPTLFQTIFDGGARRATVAQYRAAYDQTVANYRQTVLTAVQEVEDNLAAVRVLTDAIALQSEAVAAARRAADEAMVRYRAGIDPYLTVLVAQTTMLNFEQTEVNLTAQRYIASVQLIKALGGGWSIPDR